VRQGLLPSHWQLAGEPVAPVEFTASWAEHEREEEEQQDEEEEDDEEKEQEDMVLRIGKSNLRCRHRRAASRQSKLAGETLASCAVRDALWKFRLKVLLEKRYIHFGF